MEAQIMTEFVGGELHAIVREGRTGGKVIGKHPRRRTRDSAVGGADCTAADLSKARPTATAARKDDRNSAVLSEVDFRVGCLYRCGLYCRILVAGINGVERVPAENAPAG